MRRHLLDGLCASVRARSHGVIRTPPEYWTRSRDVQFHRVSQNASRQEVEFRAVLTVHHLNKSRSHRIVWLLEELGAPYVIQRYERVGRTGAAPEALKQVHPLGKSPVVTEKGAVIAESGAIVDYIVRRHGNGALCPPTDSALYDQYVHWLHYAEGSAALPLTMKGTVDHLSNTWRPLKRMVDTEVDLHLSYIDGQLKKGTYIPGDTFSAADIQLSFIGEVAGARVDRSVYRHLDQWVRMLQERPAYQQARAKAGA